MDGEWEAPQIPNPACETAPGCGTWKRPMIDNPNYKGKWKPPMIDNPNYQVCLTLSTRKCQKRRVVLSKKVAETQMSVFQGIWKPRKIPNPAYFEDLQPFKMTPFSAVGLELWSMTSDIFFDNFMITDDRNTADRWANDGWGLKKAAESAAEVSTEVSQRSSERFELHFMYKDSQHICRKWCQRSRLGLMVRPCGPVQHHLVSSSLVWQLRC